MQEWAGRRNAQQLASPYMHGPRLRDPMGRWLSLSASCAGTMQLELLFTGQKGIMQLLQRGIELLCLDAGGSRKRFAIVGGPSCFTPCLTSSQGIGRWQLVLLARFLKALAAVGWS